MRSRVLFLNFQRACTSSGPHNGAMVGWWVDGRTRDAAVTAASADCRVGGERSGTAECESRSSAGAFSCWVCESRIGLQRATRHALRMVTVYVIKPAANAKPPHRPHRDTTVCCSFILFQQIDAYKEKADNVMQCGQCNDTDRPARPNLPVATGVHREILVFQQNRIGVIIHIYTTPLLILLVTNVVASNRCVLGNSYRARDAPRPHSALWAAGMLALTCYEGASCWQSCVDTCRRMHGTDGTAWRRHHLLCYHRLSAAVLSARLTFRCAYQPSFEFSG